MPQTPRLTRRRLLAAGVGAAAIGGLEGARGSGIRTWYQHLTGACDVTAASLPRSHPYVATGSFDSRAARAQVGYAISLPHAETDVARLPLVVCLPGRDTSAEGMLNLSLPDYAAAAGGHLALACVEGGSSYWHRRASGEDRMAMLTGEFLPMLSRQRGLGHAGLGTLGWSMGGYGALLAAELRPDLFGAAAALSPAMWTTYAQQHSAVPDAFDSQTDYDRFNPYTRTEGLAHTPVFIACGRSDPFHTADVEFATTLKPRPQTLFTSGCHDDDFWRSAAPHAMAFLTRHLGSRVLLEG